MMPMERIFEQGILYDFYGPLLTEHQQEVYEAFVYENLSLSEIAEREGISRQGVHDLIKRCDKILEGYESRLHLIGRFKEHRVVLEHVRKDIESLCKDVEEVKGDESKFTRVLEMIDGMIEDL